VAALTEHAEAVRTESRRLLAEEQRLRKELHELTRRQHGIVAHAMIRAARGVEIRGRPQPSPWSGLFWRRPGRELDDVLVPHD
jgi:hypothetical protein